MRTPAPRSSPRRRAATRHAGRLAAGALGPGRRALQAAHGGHATAPAGSRGHGDAGDARAARPSVVPRRRPLLVADAGGGPLRPLQMSVAGRTSVLRQGRYLVVRVAEQLSRGRCFRLATGTPGGDRALGSAMEVLPSPRPDRYGCSAGGPARRSGPSLFGGGAGDRQAARHSRVTSRMPSRWRWWTAAYLSATYGRGWPCATWLGRERQRLGTDLTFVECDRQPGGLRRRPGRPAPARPRHPARWGGPPDRDAGLVPAGAAGRRRWLL